MTISQLPIVERFTLWRARYRAWRGRVTHFGLILRIVLWLSGFTAVLLSSPNVLRWHLGIGLAVVLPLLAMAKPGLAWVSAAEFIAIAGWFFATLDNQYPSFVLAALIGSAMYVHHSAAALAAQCRADADVTAEVRSGWWKRTAAAVFIGLLVGGIISVLAQQPLPVPPQLLLVAGLICAVAILSSMIVLLKRR